MRLIYVTRVAIPSRAAEATQVQAMARAFHRVLGDGFRLVCARGEGRPDLPEPIAWQPAPPGRGPLRRRAGFALRAARIAWRERGAVLYTRDIAVALAAVAAGAPAVYEAHQPPAGLLARAALRLLARVCRFRVVAISRALAGELRRTAGLPADRVLVAHDGAFPEAYEALRRADRAALRAELGLPADRRIVVHTGSLYKGGAELFGEVAGAPAGDILFVQVGGSEADRRRWEAHYRGLGLDNVWFVPHQPAERVRRYQVAADLLFFVSTPASPLHRWTSPLKLFEYMASGVPILGACSGAAAEVLHPGNAFCYDPQEPRSLRAALAEALADPEAAARRARRAARELRERYTWEERARRIVAFVQGRAAAD